MKLRDIVAIQEQKSGLLPPHGHPLSKIWSKLEYNNSFLIAAGLLSLTSICNTYGDCLDYSYHGNSDRADRAKCFVQVRWHLRSEVERKVTDHADYLKDLLLHGITEPEVTLPSKKGSLSHSLPLDDDIKKFRFSHLR